MNTAAEGLIATAYAFLLSLAFIGLVSLPRHLPPRTVQQTRPRLVTVFDECEVHGHTAHWEDVDGERECVRCATAEFNEGGADRLLDAVREYRGGAS